MLLCEEEAWIAKTGTLTFQFMNVNCSIDHSVVLNIDIFFSLDLATRHCHMSVINFKDFQISEDTFCGIVRTAN